MGENNNALANATQKIVIKRDGRKQEFDISKIMNAIKLADKKSEFNYDTLLEICNAVYSRITDNVVNIDFIHMIVEDELMKFSKTVYNKYHSYRLERSSKREENSDLMRTIEKFGINTDRDNANVGNNFSAKLLRIASETNKRHNLIKMPKHLAKLHENGDLYYHDLDSFNLTVNCLHIDTAKVFERGFNTGYGTIRKPKRIESAAELSCILLQSAQNDMFGGQSHVDFDNAIGEYVALTRKEIIMATERFKSCFFDEKELKKYIEDTLTVRVRQAMQNIVYNLNTMHSRAGSQVPFSSLNIGIPKNDDSALVCELFLQEYDKGLGKGEQPIFPNIIFRTKKGVNFNPDDKYRYLFDIACDVASRRMNPTFMNLDSSFNLKYYERGIIPATMG